jgi:hypothetical protein
MLKQYYRLAGGQRDYISGSIAFGGAVLDPSPYASNNNWLPCRNPLQVTLGTACLGDGDIAAEADAAAQNFHWPENLTTLFLVFTGQNVIVCSPFGGTPGVGGAQTCSPPPTAPANTPATCAYHSASFPFFNEIYGAVAYPVSSCALSLSSHPHPADTDAAINSGSHELFESATDPRGDGWCDDAGYTQGFPGKICSNGPPGPLPHGEIGDKCGGFWGPQDASGSDVVLNGHGYIVQEEWSNLAPLTPYQYVDPSGNVQTGYTRCAMS